MGNKLRIIIFKILRRSGILRKLNLVLKLKFHDKLFYVPVINGLGYENVLLKDDWLNGLITVFCSIRDGVFLDVV
jgi:hypothetical protein